MDRQDVRAEHHHGNGRKLLLNVESEIGKQAGRRRKRGDVHQQQGVAVGLCLGDGVGPEIARRAGLVLDHDRLADGGG